MRYVKIIVVFALIYLVYIGLSKFMDTSVDIAKKTTEIEKMSDNELSDKEKYILSYKINTLKNINR